MKRMDQTPGSASPAMEGMVLAWWRRSTAMIVVVIGTLYLALLGPGKAALRYLAPALLSIVTFGLIWSRDGLWLFWDRRRQTLHDKLVGSMVANA